MRGDQLRAPAGPASVAELRSTFAAGSKALSNAPTVSVSGTASAPPAGSLEHAQAQRRQLFATAPDLRTAARGNVDRAWSGMLAAVERRFGRAVDLDEWNQRGPGELMALKRARACEAQYIAIASTGGSKVAVAEALDRFCSATAAFLNEATRGWKRVDGGSGR